MTGAEGGQGEEFGSSRGHWGATAEVRTGERRDGGVLLSGGPGREGCLETGHLEENSFSCPHFFFFLSLIEKSEKRVWRMDSCAWVSRVLVPRALLLVGTALLSRCSHPAWRPLSDAEGPPRRSDDLGPGQESSRGPGGWTWHGFYITSSCPWAGECNVVSTASQWLRARELPVTGPGLAGRLPPLSGSL